VGGDFYDVFPLHEGRFGVLLGDVSGKGLLAAVCATMTRYMVRAYALEATSPAEVLARANEALWQSGEDPGLFVTAFYAVLDPQTHTLCYANAGHWPALLAREHGAEIVGGSSLALCIAPDATFQEGRLQLQPGDALLLYTDGLVEVGPEDPMIHFEAVQERLGRADPETPEQLMEDLFGEAELRSLGRLRDDVALLMLRRDPLPDRCRTAASPAESDRAPDSHPEPGSSETPRHAGLLGTSPRLRQRPGPSVCTSQAVRSLTRSFAMGQVNTSHENANGPRGSEAVGAGADAGFLMQFRLPKTAAAGNHRAG
jgi:hypothetical protein